MAEFQQARVQSAVDEMVQCLERDHIRKMQSRMFRCSAECCDRPGASMQQDRLTRCTIHCSDKAKDAFDSGSKEPAVKAQMEQCITSCVDEHVNLLPSMTRKLRETLDSFGK
ncbi:F136A protein, partial [Polypterus senegalus]